MQEAMEYLNKESEVSLLAALVNSTITRVLASQLNEKRANACQIYIRSVSVDCLLC